MIRSKQPVIIDALRRKIGVPYVHARRRKEDEVSGTVSFDIVFSTLEKTVRQMPVQVERTAEDGSKYVESFIGNVEETFLKEYRTEKAIFRTSKFYSTPELVNATPEQFDQILISEIDRLNKLTPTGNEIQPDFYFYEWTSEDLEIVPEEFLNQLPIRKLLN